MSFLRVGTAMLFLGALCGCTGFDSAKLALNDRGPAEVYPNSHVQKDLDPVEVAKTPGLLGGFVSAYIDACKIAYPNTCLSNASFSSAAAGPPKISESAASLALAKAGYDLVDNYCKMFFQADGENQKWLELAKDLTAAFGSIGTGVAALTGTGTAITPILGLGTATANNGIDIYTRNFLFGVDNIDSVQELVTTALDTHRKATILASDDNTPWTFGSAMLQIEDHQALCQAPKIKELVMQAVKSGTVTAYTASGELFSSKPAANTPAKPDTTTAAEKTPHEQAVAKAAPTMHVAVKANS